MLSARVKYYRTITYVLLALVSVCVLTLAAKSFWGKTDVAKEVVTLFISLTSGLFGSLLTIVTQGIQAARRLRSDEELVQMVEEIEAQRAVKEKMEQSQQKDATT